MFTLTRESLDEGQYVPTRPPPAAGAVVCFEGRVRDHHLGREVVGLAYEAYESLAKREGSRILAEAHAAFDVVEVVAAHRLGQLDVGDAAVVVWVAAAHRDDAFRACRFVIDALKARVPIWKKETFRDGTSEWVSCSLECAHERTA